MPVPQYCMPIVSTRIYIGMGTGQNPKRSEKSTNWAIKDSDIYIYLLFIQRIFSFIFLPLGIFPLPPTHLPSFPFFIKCVYVLVYIISMMLCVYVSAYDSYSVRCVCISVCNSHGVMCVCVSAYGPHVLVYMILMVLCAYVLVYVIPMV